MTTQPETTSEDATAKIIGRLAHRLGLGRYDRYGRYGRYDR